jgi:para-aminobenzoate synthetase
MREVEQLLAAIGAAPPRAGATRVVAIDGRSGAGKSTLAAALAHRLPAALVALEDLYGGWDGLEAGVTRLCAEVLAPLAQRRAALVRRYNWHVGAWLAPWTLEPPEILIVEGVGAGALAAEPYTSVLVWVQAAPALRRGRALARRPADADAWERWARQEDTYLERERPRERADVVIESADTQEHVGGSPA